MERIPQIARERLQAGTPAGIHPDANILTAFAERSLSDRERGSVLEHLARCRNCRDVVALALPEIESATAVTLPPRVGWMTWSTFRWSFATAGVAIIALGILQYERHSQPSTMARQISRPEAVAVNLSQPAAPSQPPASAPRTEATRSEAGKVLAKIPTASGRAGTQSEATLAVNQFHGSTHAISGAMHGPNMPAQWQQQQQQAPSRVQAFAPGPSARQQANTADASPSAQMVQHQAVEVNNEAGNTVSQPAAPNASAEQMFDNPSQPQIGKAKPALIQPGPALTSASSSPRWSITATGELQRSFDQGNTWESVHVNSSPAVGGNLARSASAELAVVDARAKQKAADKKTNQRELATPVFRAVVANGSDVWAGGTNGALYHSIDSGNRWTRIIPSANGSVLTADIVALQFSDPQHGVITTSTPDVWTTSDSGQTWQKQ